MIPATYASPSWPGPGWPNATPSLRSDSLRIEKTTQRRNFNRPQTTQNRLLPTSPRRRRDHDPETTDHDAETSDHDGRSAHRGGAARRGAGAGASRAQCRDARAPRYPERSLARGAARLSAPILHDGRLRAPDRRLLCAYRPPPGEGQRLGEPGVPQLRLTPRPPPRHRHPQLFGSPRPHPPARRRCAGRAVPALATARTASTRA
jgi:hypothetical protein